jgi:adhesin/invasin
MNMPYRLFSYFLIITGFIIGLTGCLGGGGSGDSQSGFNTTTEITDERVATVTLLVTDDFQNADGQSFISLTVIARDRTNAPLVGVEVSLTSNSDFAVLVTPKGVTGENGRFTTGVVSSVAETFQIMAIAGGVQSQPVEVNFIAPVDLIKLVATTPVLAINETTTVTVTLQEKSTQDPLPNAPFNVSVSGSAQLGKLPQETDTKGQASFTVTDSVAETITVTVTSGLLSQSLFLYFGATLKLLPELSNAIDGTTLTALLKDAAEAPIVGQQVSFNFMGNNQATLTPTTAITGEDGTAAVKIIDLPKAGGMVVVNVSSGTLTAKATVRFGEQLVDSRIATVKLTVIDDFQPADGRLVITLSVIVRDADGIPLAGIPVSLLSDSDSAFVTTLSGLTGANGHFTTSVNSRVAQTFTITPTAGGIKGESVQVTFIAPTSSIKLTAAEIVLPVGKTTTVTVTLYHFETDAFQREFGEEKPLPNATFKVNTSGNAVLGAIPLMTNADGQASFTVTDDTPENVVITVISGIRTEILSLYFGASLELLPKELNTIDEAKLKAVLKDGKNTPLVGQLVTFSFVNSNNETLSPTTVVTKEDGTAEVTVADLAKNGGLAVIKATSGLLNAEATVQFKSNFGGNRRLVATTSATVLNVGQSATITAYITDDKNIPIIGQTVNFSVTTANGTATDAKLSTSSGISDENGEVKTTISSTSGENVIVTIQADTAKQEIPLYFGAQLTLLPTQAEGMADGETLVTLTLILKDAMGVGIQDIPITLRMPTGQALLTNFHPRTDKLGRAQIEVSSIVLEEVTIEAQVDTLVPVATTHLTFKPSEPAQIILSSSTGMSPLSLNGKATITADVKDSQGNPVKDGTQVSFSTTGGGVITELALTENGKAQANFSATNQAGLVTITAIVKTVNAKTVEESITLTIAAGSAGVIEISKIEPKVIGIIGSGVAQIATIEFLVKDNLGNPVVDGTEVNFSLGNTILGGGETITTQDKTGETAIGTTNNGLVKVMLKSGRVAGNIDVIATVNETISTAAKVTIVGSDPEAKHLSLAAEFFNVAGGVTFGLLDQITAYVGDRFGNIVPDGTAITFMSEGGTIGSSIGGGAFTTTTQLGQATAQLQTAGPTVPLLGGVPTLRHDGYQCSGNYSRTGSSPDVPLCGNPGLVTIVAFTTGTESFTDVNGNGQYDVNEPYEDLSEPYIDGNDNNQFDVGELYIDVNGDHQFNQGNNQFDGPGGQSSNTTIWQSIKILFSASTAPFQVEPTDFYIPNGSGQSFSIKNIGDIYGNPLVAGSRLRVTTNNGILGGETDFIFEDTTEREIDFIQFTLASQPAQQITSVVDGKETTSLTYPPTSSATITISIESPFTDKERGGNGSYSLIIEGQINVEE